MTRTIERASKILDVLAVPAICVLLGAEHAPLLVISLAIHELSHVAVLRLCGGRLLRFSTEGLGLRIRYAASGLPTCSQLAISSAGAAANLLLAAFALAFGGYRLAAVNIALAAFNLLPIRGLDGGELLLSGLGARLEGDLPWRISHAVSIAASTALWLLSLFVQLRLAPMPEILIVSSAMLIRELMT